MSDTPSGRDMYEQRGQNTFSGGLTRGALMYRARHASDPAVRAEIKEMLAHAAEPEASDPGDAGSEPGQADGAT